ncbi:MAG TPA: MMPL family transporter, partial [Solirubrobacteraceae bacterium]|nr:MMPL family transporter [Solirubrobacteraceae bacterium]
ELVASAARRVLPAVRDAGLLIAAVLRPPARAAGRLARAAGRPLARRLPSAARTGLSSGREAARRIAAEGPLRVSERALRYSAARPQRVLGIAFALAVIGWTAGTQTGVISDVQRLVPQNLHALRDLRALQRATGVGGEIDVTVRSRDLTDPRVVEWMSGYQQSLLKRYGYSESSGCGRASLCPALSLPDLFRDSRGLTRQRVRSLLAAVPPYFSQAVISSDRRTATLAFGIRLMPLDRQQRVIDEMRRRLNPPHGVHAELAGLPVLAAEANQAVSSDWRRALLLVFGLAAVALVLFAVYRRVERALVPLVPIALATGWSALVLFLIRIPLNPMSVTLGALVIAISTEFSVLLCARYRSERERGLAPLDALSDTYRSTGAAVLASGVTAIAGFAVLIVSPINMLRDFGAVAVVDLIVSLAGVMLVLPAVLVLAERGELLTLPASALRRLRRGLPRIRRAPA